MSSRTDPSPRVRPAIRRGGAIAHDLAPGWLGSLLLHALFALLFLALVRSNSQQTPRTLVKLVPINIVELGEKTAAPPFKQAANVPQQAIAVRTHAPRNAVAATSEPLARPPARDQLASQLLALSKLREPASNLPVLDKSGASDVDATSSDAGSGIHATYSISDYVRTQVERRWSLDLGQLGARRFSVRLRIELMGSGKVVKVDILDRSRFIADATYHQIALSARNAVLLSSPIPLPAGQPDVPMYVTLTLNSRDVLQ